MTTTARYPAVEFSWELAPQATVTDDLQVALTTWHQSSRQGVFIAGSGIVGLSLALAHLREGYKVLVHTPFKVFMPDLDAVGNLTDLNYPFDLQYYAVNYYNYAFLQQLGATGLATQRGVNLYNQLTLTSAGQEPITFHTSDLQTVSTRLTNLAPQQELPALGAFVENRTMIADLLYACQQYGEQFLLLQECKVTHSASFTTAPSELSIADYLKLPAHNRGWRAEFDNGLILTLPYVLACDGANSYWREQAHIPRYLNPYPTKCMMIELETDAQTTGQFQHHTWQYLDPHGPKAWLPHTANHGVLCWYDQIATIDQLQTLTPEQLRQRILANPELVKRLGNDITVKQYHSFKLVMTRALEYAQQNVLVFGDAAHTVTPIAGQGLNIGLQDVQCYHRLLKAQGLKTQENSKGCNKPTTEQIFNQVWTGYTRERQFDNKLMQEFLNKLHYSYIGTHVQDKLFKQALFIGGKNSQFKALALAYATGDRKLLHTALQVKDTLTPVAQIIENFTVKLLDKTLRQVNTKFQAATSNAEMANSVIASAQAQGATLTSLGAQQATTTSASSTASANATATSPNPTPAQTLLTGLGSGLPPLPKLTQLGNRLSWLLDVLSTPTPNRDRFKDHSQPAATQQTTPISSAARADSQEDDRFQDHSQHSQMTALNPASSTTATSSSETHKGYTPKDYHATTLLSGMKSGLEIAQSLLNVATGTTSSPALGTNSTASSQASSPTGNTGANFATTLDKVATFATTASKTLEVVGKVAQGVTEIIAATPLAQFVPPSLEKQHNRGNNSSQVSRAPTSASTSAPQSTTADSTASLMTTLQSQGLDPQQVSLDPQTGELKLNKK